MNKTVIFWFRRDLRLDDNVGLWHALHSGFPVLPLFIFDSDVLRQFPDNNDKRVSFIYQRLQHLNNEISKKNGQLHVLTGKPKEIFEKLIQENQIAAVYTNKDYEPYGIQRDASIEQLLSTKGIDFHSFNDHVIFESHQVLKSDGLPYTVFTPFSRKWMERFHSQALKEYRIPEKPLWSDEIVKDFLFPEPEHIGYVLTKTACVIPTIDTEIIKNYHLTRNSPFLPTSRMGLHLRFGTVSIRKLVRLAHTLNPVFLNELIWREFFVSLLHQFPHLADAPFRPMFKYMPWENDEKLFKLWCEGKTGFPLVDAGMRELNETGFMHNRVRMVAASFLTRHLLIDWRWGEHYFSQKLLDYELSSNNGNWQWAAGCGCDTMPLFRMFNPVLQADKFDPNQLYINQWLSESEKHLSPIVEHNFARKRWLSITKNILRQ